MTTFGCVWLTAHTKFFGVMFLTAQHQVIDFVELFRGTLTQTSVYPREVVIEALSRNASAVILTHNHPSGKPDPSLADEVLTHAIKAALAVVDVDVLDHFIVTRRDVPALRSTANLDASRPTLITVEATLANAGGLFLAPVSAMSFSLL